MKKLIAFGIVFVLGASVASAATINAVVTTDKTVYLPGETVTWELFAYVLESDGTDGVALLAINVHSDTPEALNVAKSQIVFMTVTENFETDFGFAVGFDKQGYGSVSPGGDLLDLTVADTSPADHTSNVGEVADTTPPLPKVGEGEFVVNTAGDYTLSLSYNGANYWASPTATTATGFETLATQSAQFEVIPEPATLMLTAMGLGCLGLFRRRRS